MPQSLSFLAMSLGAYLLIQSQNLEKKAQVSIANKMQTRLWRGSRNKSVIDFGGEIQQANPPTGILLPPSTSCQVPSRLMIKLSLNLLWSISDKKQRFETRADWKITLMLDVQNNLIGILVVYPLTFLLTASNSILNPCKQMTRKNTNSVAMMLETLGDDDRQNAWYRALILFGLVRRKWTRAMSAPSNSVPYSVLRVIGERHFQKISSHMLAAIKREIPDPRPYFWSIQSRRMTMTLDIVSWRRMIRALVNPISLTLPQAPDQIQAIPSPTAKISPRTF